VKYGETYHWAAAQVTNATMKTAPKMLAFATVFMTGWKTWAILFAA
jgi:hypothetical protein